MTKVAQIIFHNILQSITIKYKYIYRTTYGKTIAMSAALMKRPLEVEKENLVSSVPEPASCEQVGEALGLGYKEMGRECRIVFSIVL